MSGPRAGVLAGGSWIVDRLRIIDRYPEQDGLARILDERRSNGGSPYNLLKDLAMLEAPFPLAGVGLVGEDDEGRAVLEDCRAHGIDTAQLRSTREAATSYTEVMSVRETGRRTFFHQQGANRLLDGAHFDFVPSNARIFHLGYLLLLERLDEIGSDGTTGSARLLRRARAAGLVTSADVVTEDSDRVAAVVDPCLPEIDCFFLNELEAERISGLSVRVRDAIDPGRLARAAGVFVERGVKRLVCIHCPAGALARTVGGDEVWQPAVRLPRDRIAGAVGAGDAFAAGFLLGLHEEWTLERCLGLGVCAAAASLLHPGSSAGVLSWRECLSLGYRFGFA